MDFREDNKVIIESMTREEAVVFIKFLHSEIARHKKDIKDAYDLIASVSVKFYIIMDD